MKKIIIVAVSVILFVVISACGSKGKGAQHQLIKQFKDVE